MDRKSSFKLKSPESMKHPEIYRSSDGDISEDPIAKAAREMLERWGIYPPGNEYGCGSFKAKIVLAALREEEIKQNDQTSNVTAIKR